MDSLDSTLASSSVSIYLNGVLQTGSTFNTTSPTNQLLGTNNPALSANTLYTYTIVAQDASGNTLTNTATFDTFSSNNPCIQAEDYNYGAGQYFANPTPLAYAGLLGTNGIDYLDLTSGININDYRPDYTTATRRCLNSCPPPIRWITTCILKTAYKTINWLTPTPASGTITRAAFRGRQ